MHKSIDVIAEQCIKKGSAHLSKEEIILYIPNLDDEIRKTTHRIHSSATYSVIQGGYQLHARVTFLEGTYQALVYNINKIPGHHVRQHRGNTG